ncbi:MAG: hypothetical protein QOK29_4306, partial [Rhodospirillaceae bacterium]|nr:hypothetical protein [Rhodospirillaceae bacterium]
MTDSRIRSMVLAAVLAGLAACAVGPDYLRPPVTVPAAYKEATDDQGRRWKAGEPQLAASGSDWWSIYHDPVLDQLERQVEVSNQNLRAAEAAYRAARAIVVQARSAFYPTVTLNGSAQRVGQGSGGGGGSTLNGGTSGGGGSQTQLDISVGASWDLDVWGKIRRTVESSAATAQASAADLASARLSAQALL